jgi:hypothetical protein
VSRCFGGFLAKGEKRLDTRNSRSYKREEERQGNSGAVTSKIAGLKTNKINSLRVYKIGVKNTNVNTTVDTRYLQAFGAGITVVFIDFLKRFV